MDTILLIIPKVNLELIPRRILDKKETITGEVDMVGLGMIGTVCKGLQRCRCPQCLIHLVGLGFLCSLLWHNAVYLGLCIEC